MVEFLGKEINTYDHYKRGMGFNNLNSFNLPQNAIWPSMRILMHYRNNLLLETMELTNKIDREIEALEKRWKDISRTEKHFKSWREAGKEIYHLTHQRNLSLPLACQKIKKQHGFSHEAMSYVMQNYKSYARRENRRQRDQKIIALYNKGYRQADIARKIGASKATISRKLKDL